MTNWYLINETGCQKIQDFISGAKRYQYLEGWVIDAENKFSLEGECILELKSWQTCSGKTETLTLQENDFYKPLEITA